MRTLFCPHCYHTIEVEAVPPKVVCPGCGLSFQIEQQPESTGSDRPGVASNKLDRFEVLEKLGHGGQGTVYKAWDPTLKRVVALKVPKQDLLSGKEESERFLREAHSVSQLRHPGIVPVFEVCRDGDTPVLVSEFVQGVTLDSVLETIARSGLNTPRELARWRNPREAAELIAACADAVHYAHEHGVIHRDLKPANIMLQGSGIRSQESEGSKQRGLSSPDSWLLTPDSCPKIMDFGLAKKDVGATTMTLDGQVLGTPAYMAPEQARGESHRVDRRADVYSLGVILYELLTGERPFRGNREMLLYQVLNAEPPNPRSLNHVVPRDLETCCLKCLQKEPKKRYQTAKELADDLRRFLRGEAIQARPVGRVERAWRWCRRNRAAAGLIATVLLLMIGTMARVFWYFEERTRRAADEAQREARLAQEGAILSYETLLLRLDDDERLTADHHLRFKLLIGTAFDDLGRVEASLAGGPVPGVDGVVVRTLRRRLESLHAINEAHLLLFENNVREAEIFLRKALEWDPAQARAHVGLGIALQKQGDLSGAVAAFQKALHHDPGYAGAYFNLANAFTHQGRFKEALDACRRGHATKWSPNSHARSAERVKSAESLVELDRRWVAFLKNEVQPADTSERLDFARLCKYKQFHGAAVRFFVEAFAAEPPAADDLRAATRYNAACSAALAGTGQGKDDPPPDEEAKTRWRKQALDWLRAHLAAWTKQLADKPDARPAVQKALRHWQTDKDLSGVRDPESLAKLPAEEQEAWKQLWAEVEAVLEKIKAPK